MPSFTQQTGDLPKEWDRLRAILAEADAKGGGNAFTDLKQPLIRAIEKGGTGEGKLLGVVVLTDGQHNWGLSPANKARELGQRGVPIYFVGIGAKDPPPDLAVLSVKATPPTVFKNAYSTIEARVLINNLPTGKVRVTLTYPNAPGQKQREPLVEEIAHDGTSAPRLVSFTARMDEPGTETLTVTAEHIAAAEHRQRGVVQHDVVVQNLGAEQPAAGRERHAVVAAVGRQRHEQKEQHLPERQGAHDVIDAAGPQ